MNRTLPALVVLLVVAACGGGGDAPAKPETTAVQPISKADMQTVVNVICAEPTAKVAIVLSNIQSASASRLQRVVMVMRRTCPDRVADVQAYIGG